jgi:D-alanine-D-alanine ligase
MITRNHLRTDRFPAPNIVAITNESPEWSAEDKADADETWQLLLDGLKSEGHTFQAFKFFDDLSCLDAFDPRAWLVWNFGEEWKGIPWSDAAVAEELERRGFAYTGSPPHVLRRTQSRMAVKERLLAAGLPTLPAAVLTDPAQASDWTVYPAIVKGANQHASFGITRESVVHRREEIEERVRFLRQTYNDDALVEPFLDTREFQVGVWGNDRPEALPPSEIVYSMFSDIRDRLHTAAWKRDPESRGFKEIQMPCPAPADRPDWRRRIEEIAVEAYKTLELRDYARFDLRMLGDEPQILDVNSNPELDETSVVLAGAMANGLTYGQMVSRIIEFASLRMPR